MVSPAELIPSIGLKVHGLQNRKHEGVFVFVSLTAARLKKRKRVRSETRRLRMSDSDVPAIQEPRLFSQILVS
jgi:hypothetical protein